MESRRLDLMRRATRTTALAFVMVVILGAPTPAAADWVDSNCTTSGGNFSGAVTRETAKSFFISVSSEGYHWAGGCWNNNNIDDTPNEALKKEFPRGEGPDCSGFVWKAWMLYATSATTFYYNPPNKYFHGPAVAESYRSATTAWTNPTGTPQYWDAFASTTHVAIYNSGTSGSGLFWEAKSEAIGSGFFSRDYYGNSAYKMARRVGWAG